MHDLTNSYRFNRKDTRDEVKCLGSRKILKKIEEDNVFRTDNAHIQKFPDTLG